MPETSPGKASSSQVRRATPAAVVDELYAVEGAVDVPYAAYDRSYEDSHYFPLWSKVLEEVQRCGARRVLDIGCGSGSFAHLLKDRSSIDYHGVDFSEHAIAKAARRTDRPDWFSVSRAEDHVVNMFPHDCIVCLEVLEHIEQDLEVVAGWKAGTRCICSVPNFDFQDHVRFFRNESEVSERYGALIDIERIVRVPRALVRGRGWREWGRQLRWSRNSLSKMAGLFGINTFETWGGWILFSGVRRG